MGERRAGVEGGCVAGCLLRCVSGGRLIASTQADRKETLFKVLTDDYPAPRLVSKGFIRRFMWSLFYETQGVIDCRLQKKVARTRGDPHALTVISRRRQEIEGLPPLPVVNRQPVTRKS